MENQSEERYRLFLINAFRCYLWPYGTSRWSVQIMILIRTMILTLPLRETWYYIKNQIIPANLSINFFRIGASSRNNMSAPGMSVFRQWFSQNNWIYWSVSTFFRNDFLKTLHKNRKWLRCRNCHYNSSLWKMRHVPTGYPECSKFHIYAHI